MAEEHERRIAERLAPPPNLRRREGVAVAILLDTSESMSFPISGPAKDPRKKIDIARSAVTAVVDQLRTYATERSDRTLLVSLFRFPAADNDDPCRVLLPFARPDPGAAAGVLGSLIPDGGTPIGEALITAKASLDQQALSKSHIIVVTDGDNTEGVNPALVVTEIGKLPENQRPRVYIIAFDVSASAFKPVKRSGALVLSASDEPELRQALDFLIAEKIMVERPDK